MLHHSDNIENVLIKHLTKIGDIACTIIGILIIIDII